jgi:5-hydroxyisourate hydrolase
MSPVTTHVLDTATGRPAAGLGVRLERRSAVDEWTLLAESSTNADGRIADLLPDGAEAPPGTYRLRFATGAWFTRQGASGFYPWVDVVFERTDGREHHHVPLLLSPFGYSTYRGS